MKYSPLFITFLILFHTNVLLADNTLELPLSKQSAAELLQRKTHGKILSVEQDKDSETVLFLVKVLHENGEIKVYRIDAATGKSPQ